VKSAGDLAPKKQDNSQKKALPRTQQDNDLKKIEQRGVHRFVCAAHKSKRKSVGKI